MSAGNPGCACSICAAGSGPGPSDEWAGRLVRRIDRQGWDVIGVAEADGLPGWAYSVGLTHSFGAGEVALFGLDVADMQVWVTDLCEAVAAGAAMPDDTALTDDVTDLPGLLRPMDGGWYPGFFGVAEEFYRGTAYTVRQVVWPDRDGRFPWDDAVGDRCQRWQPPGWLPVGPGLSATWRRILAEAG